MHPVKFIEQNCTYKRDDCMDLPAKREYNEKFDCEEVTSCWEFSDDDIEELKRMIDAGIKPIVCLSVLGGQPPVCLYIGSVNHD